MDDYDGPDPVLAGQIRCPNCGMRLWVDEDIDDDECPQCGEDLSGEI